MGGFPICGSLKNVKSAKPEQGALGVAADSPPAQGGAANAGAAKTGRFPMFGKAVSFFTRRRNEVPQNNEKLNPQTSVRIPSNKPIKPKLTIIHHREFDEPVKKVIHAKEGSSSSIPKVEVLGRISDASLDELLPESSCQPKGSYLDNPKLRGESFDSLDELLLESSSKPKGSDLDHSDGSRDLKTEKKTKNVAETGSQSVNTGSSFEQEKKSKLTPAEQEVQDLFGFQVKHGSIPSLNKATSGKKL